MYIVTVVNKKDNCSKSVNIFDLCIDYKNKKSFFFIFHKTFLNECAIECEKDPVESYLISTD